MIALWFMAVYYRRHTLYQCGDLDKFIETVLGRVESLPVEKVAEVLNGFLEQYGCDELLRSIRTCHFCIAF